MNSKIEFNQDNPKSGASYDRYESYKSATNFQEFEQLGGAWPDFKNDLERGYCRILAIKRQKTFSIPSDPELHEKFPSELPLYDRVHEMCTGICSFLSCATSLYTRITSLQNQIANIRMDPARIIHKPYCHFHGIEIPNLGNSYIDHKVQEIEQSLGLSIPRSYHIGQPVSGESMDRFFINLLEPTRDDSRECDSYDSFVSNIVDSRNNERIEDKAFDEVYFLYIAGDETMMSSMQDTLTGVKTPWTIREAIASSNPNRLDWIEACKKEMQLLIDHNTYELVKVSDLPPNTPIVTSKIAWRLKLDGDNNPIKFKARCVARGFTQVQGKNYTETFQPVARLESVRAFIALAVSLGLVIHQMDFEGAYLQGDADHEIYMSFDKMLNHEDLKCGVPEGYVAKLKKSIYGLKQAGHVWWETLTAELEKHGFKAFDAEPCILMCKEGDKVAAVVFHVDDGLLISNNTEWAKRKFASINESLKHTINPEPADWYLGMKIEQNIDSSGTLLDCKLSQPAYIEQLCKKNGISLTGLKVKTACSEKKMSKHQQPLPGTMNADVRRKQDLYRANVGAVLFLARCTMPSISFAIGRLGRFASNSGPEHWQEMTHLLKYCATIRTQGIRYSRDSMIELHNATNGVRSHVHYYDSRHEYFKVYTDSDFAGCPDTSRSTSGNVLTWMNAAISWSSSLQACVTLSTAEAEMVALCKAAQEAIWLKRLLDEAFTYFSPGNFYSSEPVKILCDNKATLSLVKNRTHHARTKHIELRNNFVRERQLAGDIIVEHVPTNENLADMFTKPVTSSKYEDHAPHIAGDSLVYS